MSKNIKNNQCTQKNLNSTKQQRRLDVDNLNKDDSENVLSKRLKPNQKTPTKAVKIEKKNDENLFNLSLEDKLPLWVAGASPAKFISLEDVIKINNSLEKMTIVHEIAVDPKFNVEDLQKKDKIYQAVKLNMHKAYWDVLRVELEKDTPNFDHVFILIKDLKELISEQLTTTNLNNALLAVEEILDLNHLKNLLEKKMLDLKKILYLVLQVLERLCAPVRDQLVQKLKNEEDVVELFKGIFELVELMKLDMANFALSQNRETIENYSSQIEREEYMKALKLDPLGNQYTKQWLRNIFEKNFSNIFEEVESTSKNSLQKTQCSSPNLKTKNFVTPKLSQKQITNLLIDFYLSLLDINPQTINKNNNYFPETLKLDEKRFLALNEKYLQLILTTASIFVTLNLAGKSISEKLDFKTTLKNELIVLLNDVTWSNYEEKLKNVYLQCNKNASKYCKENWSNERQMLLKSQIENLKFEENSICLIAKKRICFFLEQVMRRTGAELKIPPGLTVIQSELAAFASKFYAIIMHNWNTFGNFYAEILQNIFDEKN